MWCGTGDLAVLESLVKVLDELRRLGTGRGTHVENLVMVLDFEEDRRDHAHGLLTRRVTLKATATGDGGDAVSGLARRREAWSRCVPLRFHSPGTG